METKADAAMSEAALRLLTVMIVFLPVVASSRRPGSACFLRCPPCQVPCDKRNLQFKAATSSSGGRSSSRVTGRSWRMMIVVAAHPLLKVRQVKAIKSAGFHGIIRPD